MRKPETKRYNYQNSPNPFKDKTVIKYCLAFRTKLLLTIHDVNGKELEKLVDEEQNPGTYEVVFQSTVGSRQLAIGSYYYRLETRDYKNEKEMLLQK